MPFRYVVGKDGEPIMPPVSLHFLQTCSKAGDVETDKVQGMVDLIKKDSEKSLDDLF